jgi:two-component system nitrogen regulation response regulator GlnG
MQMTNCCNVWITDDDKSIRWVIEKALNKNDNVTRSFATAQELLNALENDTPDVLLSDIRMPGIDGFQLLKKLQTSHPNLPVIIMTAHSDLESAVSAFHGGAFEYLPKPFDIKEMLAVVQRACLHNKQQANSTPDLDNDIDSPEIIGAAPAMQEVFRAIGRLARSHITVLINGQSGTGKELVAKALHRHSPRAEQPFIALNMAAIPKDLMESELFGHEKGAFTGANTRRSGRFEQADNGTLFLDEIGDMPPELQTRLLRVLADNEFYSVGAHTPTIVNVRIIAATHQNLEALVEQGIFREDLFHRLNVIRIHIPPLNERTQDIPLLMQFFLASAAKELDSEVKILTAEAEDYLCTLAWPGNVRQLENICRWITVMASGREIHLSDLPPELLPDYKVNASNSCAPESETDWEFSLKKAIEECIAQGQQNIAKKIIPLTETILIKSALKHTQGHRHEAANLLGYGRNTLTRKIKELVIE